MNTEECTWMRTLTLHVISGGHQNFMNGRGYIIAFLPILKFSFLLWEEILNFGVTKAEYLIKNLVRTSACFPVFKTGLWWLGQIQSFMLIYWIPLPYVFKMDMSGWTRMALLEVLIIASNIPTTSFLVILPCQ